MKTALITGASTGIGAEFARKLAAQQMDLVLVARSADKLEQLATDLHSQSGIQVTVLPQDLTAPEAASAVWQKVNEQGWQVDLLVNNAGFGDYGTFSDRPRQKILDMIQLNITTLVDLTHQFLPEMQQQGSGSIINVASTAAFQPIPYFSVYAATKAFVLSFSEALWAENQRHGIRILALCPGPTETEFFKVAEFPPSFGEGQFQQLTTPEAVVQAAMTALEKNQANVVPGGPLNQFLVNVSRFFPREILVQGIAQQFKPPQRA